MQLGSSRGLRASCAILTTAIALAGCGGAADTENMEAMDSTAAACPTPTDSVIAQALETFISTRQPSAMRFLNPLGTDSAVPDPSSFPFTQNGRKMYLWPMTAEQQKTQQANMIALGSWVTMVVSYHGMSEMPDGRQSITFSGSYIDRANSGINIPRTPIYFDCKVEGAGRFVASDMTNPGQP